ncbi:hypothetical protein J4410_07850 [Candidatus Woesearchaeota archaeon]|nr:hypothetical protein [Candidatus Woesearchaeota archaeon]
MAEIICTVNEFHKYIGPRIRNSIQYMTKRRKKELNHLCQICKEKRELEAAHVKGKTRKVMIEILINKYRLEEDKNKVKLDIDKFEKELLAAHKHIEECFKFLCSQCHIKYDSEK